LLPPHLSPAALGKQEGFQGKDAVKHLSIVEDVEQEVEAEVINPKTTRCKTMPS
jgi:hypothetical protein